MRGLSWTMVTLMVVTAACAAQLPGSPDKLQTKNVDPFSWLSSIYQSGGSIPTTMPSVIAPPNNQMPTFPSSTPSWGAPTTMPTSFPNTMPSWAAPQPSPPSNPGSTQPTAYPTAYPSSAPTWAPPSNAPSGYPTAMPSLGAVQGTEPGPGSMGITPGVGAIPYSY